MYVDQQRRVLRRLQHLAEGRRRLLGPVSVEGHILDRQHVAARRVESDRRLARRQVAQFSGGARLPCSRPAFRRGLRQTVVHHDGRGQPPHRPGLSIM